MEQWRVASGCGQRYAHAASSLSPWRVRQPEKLQENHAPASQPLRRRPGLGTVTLTWKAPGSSASPASGSRWGWETSSCSCGEGIGCVPGRGSESSSSYGEGFWTAAEEIDCSCVGLALQTYVAELGTRLALCVLAERIPPTPPGRGSWPDQGHPWHPLHHEGR